MTKVTEKYYCDVCGKESPYKLNGVIDIVNGATFGNKYVHYKEVCTDCCNKVLSTIIKIKEKEKELSE